MADCWVGCRGPPPGPERGPPPGTLQPLGSGPQPEAQGPPRPPGTLSPRTTTTAEPSGDGLGVTIGTPDPSHGGEVYRQVMMKLMEAEKLKQAYVQQAARNTTFEGSCY